jgi:glycosyltransferase involved in cell wall biosynthesis
MLTICLITKGRANYLPAALKSYEHFIDTGNVNVVLIDNCSDSASKKILDEWRQKFTTSVSYYRLDVNSPTADSYWDILNKLNLEWVVFPGDDDQLVFEIYDLWRKELGNNPDLKAFSSSAQIIDAQGRSINRVRTSPIFALTDRVQVLIQAFHEAPFLWPGLFFKFSEVPEVIIKSRYVFDWWIGLHLILADNYLVTQSIGVKYRVHPNQESFQASNRRKFFEGFNMLTSFIESKEFSSWVQRLTDPQKKDFLKKIQVVRPIYSQDSFYLSIIKDLTKVILSNSSSHLVTTELVEEYAKAGGVLTKYNDLNNIFSGFLVRIQKSPGNFKFVCTPGACEQLQEVGLQFNQDSDYELTAYCNHSKANNGAVFIDCAKFKEMNRDEIADNIILRFVEEFEAIGIFDFSFTPREKLLISYFRSKKPRFPRKFKDYLIHLTR